eukprot:jgi/Tetstr1/461263/TSEL_006391.t1
MATETPRRSGGLSFDLVSQLSFYGAYHSNKINQLIHFVFVPLISWSVLVWTCEVPLIRRVSDCADPSPLPEALRITCGVDLAGAIVAVLAAFYVCIEPCAGITWTAAVGLPLLCAAKSFSPVANSGWIALAVHVFSWYMQIHPGHGVFEKRRPALLDSFFQSLVMANLFVWMELMFFLGYRPGLHAAVIQRVDSDIQAWKAARKAE